MFLFQSVRKEAPVPVSNKFQEAESALITAYIKFYAGTGSEADVNSCITELKGQAKSEDETRHVKHLFAVLDKAVVVDKDDNKTKRLFLNERGIPLVTSILDDLYSRQSEKPEEGFPGVSQQQILQVTYPNKVDAGYLRQVLGSLFKTAKLKGDNNAEAVRVSLEYDTEKIPQELAIKVLPTDKTKKSDTDFMPSENTSAKKSKGKRIGKQSTMDLERRATEWLPPTEAAQKAADLKFVQDNWGKKVEASNDLTLIAGPTVQRKLAYQYVFREHKKGPKKAEEDKRGQESIEELHETLDASLGLLASKKFRLKVDEAFRDFLKKGNNLADFDEALKAQKSDPTEPLVTRSEASVEMIKCKVVSWDQGRYSVLAELQANIDVCEKYGTELNDYLNALRYEAWVANKKDPKAFQRIDIQIADVLHPLQEIDSVVLGNWLNGKSADGKKDIKISKELMAYLKSYSDAQVRQDRYAVLMPVIKDLVNGNKEAIDLWKNHLSNSIEAVDADGKKIIDFAKDSAKIKNFNITNADLFNRQLSIQANDPRAPGNYWDNKLNILRKLGYGVVEKTTLSAEFVEPLPAIEIGKTCTLTVKATKDGGVPSDGRLVIKAYIQDGTEVPLNPNDEKDGTFTATFTPDKPGKYCFVAYYVDKDGSFFSKRTMTPPVEVEPEEYWKPEMYANTPESKILPGQVAHFNFNTVKIITGAKGEEQKGKQASLVVAHAHVPGSERIAYFLWPAWSEDSEPEEAELKKELAYTVVAADKSLYYVVVDRPLEVQEYSKPGGKPSVTKRTIPKQALVKMASNGAVAVKSSFEGKPVWVTLDGRQAVQGDKFEEVQDGGFTYRIPKAKDSKPEMRDVLQTQPESELNKTIPTMEISAGLQEKALIPRAIAIPDEDLHLGSKTFTPDQLRSLAQQRVIAVVGGDDKEPIIYGIDGHRIGPLSWLSPGISPVAPDLFMRRPADDSEFGFNVLFPVLFPEEVASVGAIIYSEEVRGGKYTRPKK